jgi:hypothetical protein
VGDCDPVHLDVVVITEIQELLPCELGAIVGDDGDGTPKWKIMSWMKLTICLELILARGLASIHLVNLSITTSRWVKPPGVFLKGPKRTSPHMANDHVMGVVWRSWAGVWPVADG